MCDFCKDGFGCIDRLKDVDLLIPKVNIVEFEENNDEDNEEEAFFMPYNEDDSIDRNNTKDYFEDEE